MYKKQNRLTHKKDFENVYRNGKASFNNILGIKAVKNNLNRTRIGIIVSTKVSKLAVRRNLVKRRIREIIKLRLDDFIPGYDCMIIALPPILGQKYQKIKEGLEKNFKKLEVLKSK